MPGLFLILGAIGGGDLVALLTAREDRRTLLRTLGALASAVLLGAFSGYTIEGLLFWVPAATLAALLWGRSVAAIQRDAVAPPAPGSDSTQRRALLIVFGFIAVALLTILSTPYTPSPMGGRMGQLLDQLPYGSHNHSAAWVLAVGACMLFLAETSNILVRLMLISVSVPVAMLPPDRTAVERTIRGGRLIGPLERFLVFGLALAGQPTAAALVISAKGLLRYPEIRRPDSPAASPPQPPAGAAAAPAVAAPTPATPSAPTAQPAPVPAADATGADEKDAPTVSELSEYLVIGSLVSWTLALSLIVLLPPN